MKWIQTSSGTIHGNAYDSWDLVADDAPDDGEGAPSLALLDHYIAQDQWDYLLAPGVDPETEKWVRVTAEMAHWILDHPDEFYMETVL